MKYALSARYGGLLVETSECDYSSFKHLHLLCPECKRSVYLVAGAERKPHERKLKDGGKTEVKGSAIEAYFAHHPAVSRSQVNDCELRVSKISAIQKEAIKLKARQQLVRKLHSHFWKILQTSSKINEFEEKIEIVRHAWTKVCVYEKRKSDRVYQILIDNLTRVGKADKAGTLNSVDKVLKVFEGYFGWLKDRTTGCAFGVNKDLLEFFDSWQLALNRSLQISITQEMLAFLLEPRQTPLLQELIEFCLFEEIYIRAFSEKHGGSKVDQLSCFGFTVGKSFEELKQGFYTETQKLVGIGSEDLWDLGTEVWANLIQAFLFTDWAGEYARLENLEQNLQLTIARGWSLTHS